MHADNSIDEDEDNNALGNPTLEGCQEHDHNAPESANQEPEVPLDLRTFQVACLIINKMIGTGIFFTPSTVLRLVGSKSGALSLWIAGAVYSYLSILIYLEYGRAWPLDGGEFVYIAKVIPVPPLIAATAFGWFFCFYSNSVGNGINGARYFILAGNTQAQPSDWQIKYVGLTLVFAICAIQYRYVRLTLWMNFGFAVFKMVFLIFLIFACIVRLGINNHWTHVTHRGKDDYNSVAPRSPTDIILAMYLVLYSYQGWENANYITGSIYGDTSEKRHRRLKWGALLAVTSVSILYIIYNALLFLVLDVSDIYVTGRELAGVALARCFGINVERHLQHLLSSDSASTQQYLSPSLNSTLKGVYALIGFSAIGNLVGVIFTNSRVKREVARAGLIPASKFWAKSSKFGKNVDRGLGTPTGGLILHSLMTWIMITSVPLYNGESDDGLRLFVNIYTYGHTLTGILLGLGLSCPPALLGLAWIYPKSFKQKWACGWVKARMNCTTESVNGSKPTFEYTFWFRNPFFRVLAGLTYIALNGILLIIPFKNSRSPETGKPRRIYSGTLGLVAWLSGIFGVFVGLYILLMATHILYYSSSQKKGPVLYEDRTWEIIYPEGWDRIKIWEGLQTKRWSRLKQRLWVDGEMVTVEKYNALQQGTVASPSSGQEEIEMM